MQGRGVGQQEVVVLAGSRVRDAEGEEGAVRQGGLQLARKAAVGVLSGPRVPRQFQPVQALLCRCLMKAAAAEGKLGRTAGVQVEKEGQG